MMTKTAKFSAWRAGSMIGAPDILPLSLAKAMIEPAKVIAPMAAPKLISIQRLSADGAVNADAKGLRRVERRACRHALPPGR